MDKIKLTKESWIKVIDENIPVERKVKLGSLFEAFNAWRNERVGEELSPQQKGAITRARKKAAANENK